MGDMVLTEDQVNPVMSVALDNGLEVTALHNHFLGESPRVREPPALAAPGACTTFDTRRNRHRPGVLQHLIR